MIKLTKAKVIPTIALAAALVASPLESIAQNKGEQWRSARNNFYKSAGLAFISNVLYSSSKSGRTSDRNIGYAGAGITLGLSAGFLGKAIVDTYGSSVHVSKEAKDGLRDLYDGTIKHSYDSRKEVAKESGSFLKGIGSPLILIYRTGKSAGIEVVKGAVSVYNGTIGRLFR